MVRVYLMFFSSELNIPKLLVVGEVKDIKKPPNNRAIFWYLDSFLRTWREKETFKLGSSMVLSFCHFLEYLLFHESFWFHHVLRMTGRMFIKAVVRKAIAAGKATRPDGTVSKLVGTMNKISLKMYRVVRQWMSCQSPAWNLPDFWQEYHSEKWVNICTSCGF